MFQDEDPLEIHSVSTSFRLKHKQLGCYLATTGKSYPAWGYQQGEVVCKYSVFSRDKNTWWNIEKHVNDKLPLPATEYVHRNQNSGRSLFFELCHDGIQQCLDPRSRSI